MSLYIFNLTNLQACTFSHSNIFCGLYQQCLVIVDLTLSAFSITSFQRIGKYNLLIRCHNGFIKLFYTHEVGKGCVGAVLGLLIVCINITSMLLTFQCVEVTTSIYEYHTSIINLPNLHYRVWILHTCILLKIYLYTTWSTTYQITIHPVCEINDDRGYN